MLTTLYSAKRYMGISASAYPLLSITNVEAIFFSGHLQSKARIVIVIVESSVPFTRLPTTLFV